MPRQDAATTETRDPHAIEHAIVELCAGMRALNSTRLKRDTIVTLLHDQTKVAKRTINAILLALDHFELHHLKPTPAHIRKAVEEVVGRTKR